MTKKYSEKSIRVLKGLEPVQERPGMYTRTETPLHIVQEVIDNCIDEVLAGHANLVEVCLYEDGSVSVEDNGRGIPVGIHPEEKISTLELVFTRLHAGGKFNKSEESSAYRFSGGLHGVGVSVTNALSRRLDVTVWREEDKGAVHQMAFEHGAVAEKLKHRQRQKGEKTQGSRIRLWPEAKYFDTLTIPQTDLEHLLRAKSVLVPGLTIRLSIEKNGQFKIQEWHYADGLVNYLEKEIKGEPIVPLFHGEHTLDDNSDEGHRGESVAWAVAFTEDGAVVRESFVNLIPTIDGGTHEAGLREGLFTAIRNFAELHALLPKGIKLMPEDMFVRTSFILSVRLLDPQFQGQTKEKLSSRDALKLVSRAVLPALELWLNQYLEQGKKLAQWVIAQAQARTRSAQKVEKRKGSGVAVLPGKLTDCESDDPRLSEIFLVEGDSAGGSAKMGRDKFFQAILPLRGKVLNTWEVDANRLFANNEVHDIAIALGVDPHDNSDKVDLSRLRYHKICVLSDADVDGAHIQVLLLTLFFRHFPQLVREGYVYVAQPPLFRLDVAASGKRAAQKFYLQDAPTLKKLQEKLKREGVKDSAQSIARFKGLGEMSAVQLWETTMNPDTRTLLQVQMGDFNWSDTNERFAMLMGKNEAATRRQWLEKHGNEVVADI